MPPKVLYTFFEELAPIAQAHHIVFTGNVNSAPPT